MKLRITRTERLKTKLMTSLEELPRDWLETVSSVEDAEMVAEQIKRAEELTVGVILPGGRPRTYSGNVGRKIVEAVESGRTVQLVDVPLSELYVGGSSGSERRQNYFKPAVDELGAEAVLRRLPPVLLREDRGASDFYSATEAHSGNERYYTYDGNTRIMVANNEGLETIRAYVISSPETT